MRVLGRVFAGFGIAWAQWMTCVWLRVQLDRMPEG